MARDHGETPQWKSITNGFPRWRPGSTKPYSKRRKEGEDEGEHDDGEHNDWQDICFSRARRSVATLAIASAQGRPSAEELWLLRRPNRQAGAT